MFILNQNDVYFHVACSVDTEHLVDCRKFETFSDLIKVVKSQHNVSLNDISDGLIKIDHADGKYTITHFQKTTNIPLATGETIEDWLVDYAI